MCPSVLHDRATGADARTSPSTAASRDAPEAIDNVVNAIVQVRYLNCKIQRSEYRW
jgi:hypothetical protein